jgi:hypothetical protein
MDGAKDRSKRSEQKIGAKDRSKRSEQKIGAKDHQQQGIDEKGIPWQINSA